MRSCFDQRLYQGVKKSTSLHHKCVFCPVFCIISGNFIINGYLRARTTQKWLKTMAILALAADLNPMLK